MSATNVPVEVAMVDGSRWIVYYRLSDGRTPSGYAHAMTYVRQDIAEGRLMPAEDLDRVQRRSSQVNMAFVVSVHDPSAPAEQDGDDR